MTPLFQENSEHFITETNIDEAIEKALTNIVDHNFAIDTEGNIFEGRHTKPVKPPPTHENEIPRAQAVN